MSAFLDVKYCSDQSSYFSVIFFVWNVSECVEHEFKLYSPHCFFVVHEFLSCLQCTFFFPPFQEQCSRSFDGIAPFFACVYVSHTANKNIIKRHLRVWGNSFVNCLRAQRSCQNTSSFFFFLSKQRKDDRGPILLTALVYLRRNFIFVN